MATQITWREVTAKLDPTAFTLLTVLAGLANPRVEPWAGFAEKPNDCRGSSRYRFKPGPKYCRGNPAEEMALK